MKNIIVALKERFKKRKGRVTHAEALHWRAALSDYYQKKFGVKMHPLQSDPSMVPPFEVAVQVQAPNKCDPDTFFATGYRQTIDYLEELTEFGLDPAKMGSILEFGVGAGRLLVHYLPFKARLYGCDANPFAAEWTRKTMGKLAEIKLTSLEPPLPYETGTFDYIFANSVFTHIPFALHEPWVAELSRVLKPGGCLIATVHDFEKIQEWDAPEGWFERNAEKGFHRNTYFSKERLLEIWRPHFEALEVRPRKVQTHVIAVKRVSSQVTAPVPRVSIEGTQSFFHKARSADIAKEPFPHLVIRNALDPALYERLAAEFPPDEVIMKGKPAGNNNKHFYGAAKVLRDERVSPLWKDFFKAHLTRGFYQEAVALFADEILALYPDLETRLKKNIKDLRTGIRHFDSLAEAALDCQFAINSPVLERSSAVRGPHLDGADTLYQGLLYFRDERDDAGGDLEFYRFKEGVDLSGVNPRSIDGGFVSKAATVRYEKNTLVAFLNSKESLHGVSPRAVTSHTRRYFNVLCDLPIPLYEFSTLVKAQGRFENEY